MRNVKHWFSILIVGKKIEIEKILAMPHQIINELSQLVLLDMQSDDMSINNLRIYFNIDNI